MKNNSATEKYTYSDLTAIGRRKKAARIRQLFDYFIPGLEKGASILEVGPGRGEFALESLRRGFSYTGIEPSKELRQKLEVMGISVVDQNIPPIQLENNRFDLVHSYDFVEHLKNFENVMEFFSEAYRVLRPGGYISVIAPNYLTIGSLFYRYEYQHSYVTTKDRLVNLLGDSGFSIVHSKSFLYWLSPGLNKIDRLLAHTLIPIATNPMMESIVKFFSSEEFLFRIHKNTFDHIGVLAQKSV